jgi:hypothetical protein
VSNTTLQGDPTSSPLLAQASRWCLTVQLPVHVLPRPRFVLNLCGCQTHALRPRGIIAKNDRPVRGIQEVHY